jgi:hypothetical protein
MKKIIYIAAAVASLVAALILNDYRLFVQKQEFARAKALYANEGLDAAKREKNAEEWKIFRKESELKIKDYKIQLAELNVKTGKKGEIFDDLYKKNIPYLDQQVNYMKARLDNYEKSPGNWESFKYGFNNEIALIGNELRDLSVNNNK